MRRKPLEETRNKLSESIKNNWKVRKENKINGFDRSNGKIHACKN